MAQSFVRSSRSAFSSPEPKNVPPRQITQSSSAPSESPIRKLHFPKEQMKEPHVNRQLSDVALRCKQVNDGVEQLKKDREYLKQSIEASKYDDKNLKEHLVFVRNVLEKALETVASETDKRSRSLWKELGQHMHHSVTVYEQNLMSCPERKELLEAKKCLFNLEQLLQGKHEDEAKLTCCVCFEKQVCCAYNCGHVFCDVCTKKMHECPMCNQQVKPEEIRFLYFT